MRILIALENTKELLISYIYDKEYEILSQARDEVYFEIIVIPFRSSDLIRNLIR